MGFDWEEILGADGDDLQDAWESNVWDAERKLRDWEEDSGYPRYEEDEDDPDEEDDDSNATVG